MESTFTLSKLVTSSTLLSSALIVTGYALPLLPASRVSAECDEIECIASDFLHLQSSTWKASLLSTSLSLNSKVLERTLPTQSVSRWLGLLMEAHCSLDTVTTRCESSLSVKEIVATSTTHVQQKTEFYFLIPHQWRNELSLIIYSALVIESCFYLVEAVLHLLKSRMQDSNLACETSQ
jgi:hypothetical protein